MFDVGGPELLLILVAVILLFGPKKIPEISQMLGKGVQKIRKAQSQFQTQMTEIEKEVKSVADPEVKPQPNTHPPKEITDKYVNKTDNNEEIKDNDGFDKFYANRKKESGSGGFVPRKPRHISDDEETHFDINESKKPDSESDMDSLSSRE